MKRLTRMTEIEFIDLYEKVVERAKAILAQNNKTCGRCWPAGQSWDGLGGSSKAIFMERAREEMKVDSKAFLKIVREWPWTDAGYRKVELAWN